MMHTDHVGSLLRPAAVLQTRDDHQHESVAIGALREVEDAAIRDALDLQRAVGLEVYTDGEIRRGAWMTDVADAIDGFVEVMGGEAVEGDVLTISSDDITTLDGARSIGLT